MLNEIFKIIDTRIEKILSNPAESQLEQLSTLYWKTWTELKDKMGTSAGWPWFGEYIVFSVIRRNIEDRIGVMRVTERDSYGSVKVFYSEYNDMEYILAHNAILKLKDTKPVRPDILLMEEKGLIFTIDVKVVITSSWAMARPSGGALSKLSRTINDSRWTSKPLGYLISLHEKMPTDASKCTVYQKQGVRIVGPRGGNIESKLQNTQYPMVTFDTCLHEINERLE